MTERERIELGNLFLGNICKIIDGLHADLKAACDERDQLRLALQESQQRVKELEDEAESTLKFYAEQGRVVVKRDGNAVQRLSASAEITISKQQVAIQELAAALRRYQGKVPLDVHIKDYTLVSIHDPMNCTFCIAHAALANASPWLRKEG